MKNTVATLGSAAALMMTPMAVEAQTPDNANRLGDHTKTVTVRTGAAASLLIVQNGDDVDFGGELTTSPMFNGGFELGAKYVRDTRRMVNVARETALSIGMNSNLALGSPGNGVTGKYVHLQTNGPSAQIQLIEPSRGKWGANFSPSTILDLCASSGIRDPSEPYFIKPEKSMGFGGRGSLAVGFGNENIQLMVNATLQYFKDSMYGATTQTSFGAGIRLIPGAPRGRDCNAFKRR